MNADQNPTTHPDLLRANGGVWCERCRTSHHPTHDHVVRNVAAESLFDVVATTIKPPHAKRIMASGKTERNAEAIVKMAIMRRGVDEEFFAAVPAGSVTDADR